MWQPRALMPGHARDAACAADALEGLFRRRRFIRQFKDEPVPREALERIVEAAAPAPPATDGCSRGLKMHSRARGRLMLRMMVSGKKRTIIDEHLLPGLGAEPGKLVFWRTPSPHRTDFRSAAANA